MNKNIKEKILKNPLLLVSIQVFLGIISAGLNKEQINIVIKNLTILNEEFDKFRNDKEKYSYEELFNKLSVSE